VSPATRPGKLERPGKASVQPDRGDSDRLADTPRRKRNRASAIAGTLLKQPWQPFSASTDLSSTPEPPYRLPEARIVHVPGRGEFFVRDSGGDGEPVLLLHGWTVSADLNWYAVYRPLINAGYRVLAMDHRGHGRGLRSPRPFRLSDCADDAAAVLDTLGVGPVVAVGYSMGGPIAQLLARSHAGAVSGIVLCATSTNWGGAWMRVLWSGMTGLRLALGLAPRLTWSLLLGVLGTPAAANAWLSGELSRGSSIDIAEAGRELGRFDSRAWIDTLEVPAVVIVTSRDNAVPPYKQRDLACRLSARRIEIARDHDAAVLRASDYTDALLTALAQLKAGRTVAV
jgi:pimeloyl-ACP methyl ester carboxylesterase